LQPANLPLDPPKPLLIRALEFGINADGFASVTSFAGAIRGRYMRARRIFRPWRRFRFHCLDTPWVYLYPYPLSFVKPRQHRRFWRCALPPAPPRTVGSPHRPFGWLSINTGGCAPWRACYNAAMTLVEITYELQSPLTQEQLRHLGEFANTYGLRRFRVDEARNQLSFEYDASRLRDTQVAHVLGQARIAVTRKVN
jgi:hypothetical protein